MLEKVTRHSHAAHNDVQYLTQCEMQCQRAWRASPSVERGETVRNALGGICAQLAAILQKEAENNTPTLQYVPPTADTVHRNSEVGPKPWDVRS